MGNKKPRWTKEQIEFLIKNLNKMYLKEMAKLPLFKNRTYKSLQYKSSHLGLKRDWTRENNPRWKGGRYNRDGYIWLTYKYECPYCDRRGRVAEHKYVWWKHYKNKDPILVGEIIHHINENNKDNRICNLQKMKRGEHMRSHKIIRQNRRG